MKVFQNLAMCNASFESGTGQKQSRSSKNSPSPRFKSSLCRIGLGIWDLVTSSRFLENGPSPGFKSRKHPEMGREGLTISTRIPKIVYFQQYVIQKTTSRDSGMICIHI